MDANGIVSIEMLCRYRLFCGYGMMYSLQYVGGDSESMIESISIPFNEID
jgi:hypothetical protein